MRIKVISTSLVALALSASPAHAQRKYGMAGCGLGSILIGKGGGQVTAATTNGTSTNQAFGISSGTSNCLTDKQLAALQKQRMYVYANFSTLQKEMAQGSGETIIGLSEVLGCESTASSQVTSQLVGAYSKIFSQPGIDGVLEAAKTELKRDPSLASRCVGLG